MKKISDKSHQGTLTIQQMTGNSSIPKYNLQKQNWTIIFGIPLM